MNFKTSSQYGECAVLHAHFLGRPPGYFIDIGAADGIRYSNTLNLINNDWSGILIEPCHHFLKTLESNYFEHDKVKIFPGAISNYDGTSKFHVWKEGGDSQISTIVEHQYESIKNFALSFHQVLKHWLNLWLKKGMFHGLKLGEIYYFAKKKILILTNLKVLLAG